MSEIMAAMKLYAMMESSAGKRWCPDTCDGDCNRCKSADESTAISAYHIRKNPGLPKTDPVALFNMIMGSPPPVRYADSTEEEMEQLKALPNAYLCKDGSVFVDRDALEGSNLEYAPKMLSDSPDRVMFHIKGMEKKVSPS